MIWYFFLFFLQSTFSFFLKFNYFYLFVAALSLCCCAWRYSSLRCTGFSLRWLLLLRSTGSRHAGFSSCSTRAQLLRGMWDLPGPGIEPVSPALAGGFLTTAPPGSPGYLFLSSANMGVSIYYFCLSLIFRFL